MIPHFAKMLTFWIRFSWVCFMASVTSTCTLKRCTVKQFHFSRQAHSVENSILVGYTFKNLTVSSHKHCFEQCARDCRCISFNFVIEATTNNCHLNQENRHLKPNALERTRGFSYSDLGIDYSVKAGATCRDECRNNCCRDNPCPNGATCHEICDSNKKRFHCSCMPGYKGDVCDQALTSCSEVRERGDEPSGVYTLDPDGQGTFEVFCDLNMTGEAWVVFQRRLDGSVDFYRGWGEYERGFGNLSGEFWLGNEMIHRLTNQAKKVTLRIELEDFTGYSCYAEYDDFSISGANRNYSLNSVGKHTGSCLDSLTYSVGASFSAKDRDLDSRGSNNCAVDHTGAWWYKSCTQANLNGQYLPANNPPITGIYWYKRSDNTLVPLKTVTMKLKPSQ